VSDPQELVNNLDPPVSVYEPKHSDKKIWWSQWLDLQQAQDAPLVLRQAAELMYQLHEQYKTQQGVPESVGAGLVQGAGMAASQAPSALGQVALQQMGGGGADPNQQAQQQHEKDQQTQEHELAATTHVSDQQHELKTKALEGQIQMAVTQQQGQNAVESAKVAGENALKIQKAKPTPKPVGKAAA
jgi:hypothetical protein